MSVGVVADNGAGWQWREGQSYTRHTADITHHWAAAAEQSRCRPGADVDALTAARSETGGASAVECSDVTHSQPQQVSCH